VPLTLAWRDTEDPGDATPGICRFDADAWELLGRQRSGPRQVTATIDRAGAYALMVDRMPPRLGDVSDAPNPFPSALEDASWKLRLMLSEPADVSAAIEGPDRNPVRTLLQDAPQPGGPLEIARDGKDDRGQLAADGTYAYRVVARDESKLESQPLTGPVSVFNGDIGSARGAVELADAAQPARVEVADTTLSTDCDVDGTYWILGLTPGSHKLRFSASGHFDEQRDVELPTERAEIDVPPVALSDVALTDVRTSCEIFTPNDDGVDDYAALSFTMQRACPIDAIVYSADDRPIAVLHKAQTLPVGENVVLWHGVDDDHRPQPSGWYTVRLVAYNRGEAIPQQEVKVLLDRGLVQNAHAFPGTFSPDGDGFADVVEIGYNLQHEAAVSVRILQDDRTPVREIADGWLGQSGG